MAAPMATKSQTCIPNAHFPLNISSNTCAGNAINYGSGVTFSDGNNDSLHFSKGSSHVFSCSVPLPIHFKHESPFEEGEHLKTNNVIKRTDCNVFPNSCLAYVPADKNSGCLILPSGPSFTKIKICSIEHKQGNCIEVKDTTTMDVTSTVRGISWQRTHGQDFVIVQAEETCFMCKLEREERGSYKLISGYFIDQMSRQFSTVRLSPYISEEACIASTSGHLFLWREGRLEKVNGNSTSQLSKQKTWCSVHFGGHPRCMIYSNPSSVCLYDIRCPSVKVSPLFTIEDLQGESKDCITVCQNSSQSTFYHTLATDDWLCLLDERFPKMPILKTNHMLESVPRFMSDFCDHNDTHVYIGSFQPIVHRVSWTSCENYPLQLSGFPRRIPKKIDLLGIPNIRFKDSRLIKRKLSAPLWGLQVIQYYRGHALLQLDSNGEVFYQMFEEKIEQSDTSMIEEENSAQPYNLNIPGSVQQVKAWINKWEANIEDKHDPDKTRDISNFFSGIVDSLPGFMACPICMSKISEVLDINKYGDIVCPSCRNTVTEARAFKAAAENDGVISTENPVIPSKDPDLCEVSENWNSLSHVLYNSWYGESPSLLDKTREDDDG